MKKYIKCYYNLINRALLEKRYRRDDIYYEGHHVKLKCLGGKFIVLLTGREHYLAHFLLYKHYKSNGNKNQKIKSARAWKTMTFCSSDNRDRYTSHTFSIAREKFVESMTGENNPMFGKKQSKEFCKKVSDGLNNMSEEAKLEKSIKQSHAKKNKSWEEIYGIEYAEEKRKQASDLASSRIGENHPMFGKTTSDETKEKLSQALIGKSKSKEHCKNISQGWEKRKILICPHCLLESNNSANMKRWHFDNCKKFLKDNK
jgi:hypothetical protein